jgi:D-3-phosphoglycerate dehydrogenase
VAALREGWIGGAALDVYEQEPLPPEHPLRSVPNVILTPHAAWYSEEAEWEVRRKAAEEVRAVLEGRSLRHPMQPVTARS